MNRVRFAVAATLVGATLSVGASVAAAQAPALQPILAGKQITPPLRGEALIEFTQPVTKRNQASGTVQTTIKLRNASAGPVARLTIAETWYDKSGAIVAGGRGAVKGVLQPGEVTTVVIDTPYNAKMSSNNWNFSHANGDVKPAKVKTIDGGPADAGAKKADAPAKKK